MKSLKNYLKIGVLAGVLGASTLLPSCERDVEDGNRLPHYSNASEKTIKKNMNFPSGLSDSDEYSVKGKSAYGTKGYAESTGEFDAVFIEPMLLTEGAKGYEVYMGPRISELSGTLEDVQSSSTSTIAEFDMSKYFEDFGSFIGYHRNWEGDIYTRPIATTLDNIVLEDGSIITSSTNSDKLFITSPSGESSVYKQSSELKWITDMDYFTDRKIYAVQAPEYDLNDSTKLIRPKRVISIDANKVIKVECELPTKLINHRESDYIPNWWRELPLMEKEKIEENSEAGKLISGKDFYVSDLLEGKILGIDAARNVEVFANVIAPASITVDSQGYLYVITTPLWGEGLDPYALNYKSEIKVINPDQTSSEKSKVIYTFDDETVKSYDGIPLYYSFRYNNRIYQAPAAYNVTNILYESDSKLDFVISKSYNNELRLVSVFK